MDTFEKNVFLNCPFDPDYREMLISAVFTIMYLGMNPRLSLERADSGESRIHKILELIQQSKYGIHDLSRIIAKKKDEHYRMNMPFELGIDYGCQKLVKGKCEDKKILVLEEKQYRYQAALSDLSGSDIMFHNNEAIEIVKVIRNWFVTEGHSYKKIWYTYNDFMGDLDKLLIEQGYDEDDFPEVPIPEIMSYMKKWLKENK